MKLLSVNVSEPRLMFHKGRIFRSAIFKKPAGARVMLRALNIEGDAQGDRKNHGGPHKAAYAYAWENYEFWKKELGRDDFVFGQFGENLTAEGMTEEAVCIGDVFRIGGALVEVSQPRNPCYKLGIRMGSADFVRRFIESCRLGIYLRVIEEGEIGAGDAIERIKKGRTSVREIARLRNIDTEDFGGIKAAIREAALAPEVRSQFEERLKKAGISVD